MSQDFVRVASISEVPEGSLKTVALGEAKVVIANVGANYYAMSAICTHAQWDLADGELEGETVICPGHRASWNLNTGEAEFYSPLDPLPLYEVKVEGSEILIKTK